ncbi:hypothetical protein HER10_EVM0007446 [Colletotrichum scovillei]|uniref:uncharacterized protein n=1 Tax=Colletotrichum scovillei TaxID=1209932 RepID=UPI0015C34EE0|nr:uncharacterized protein HER10_EVM0007446 [Colletotrichum scovillei]KAF4777785.1 hypothetical protein HER10_EVM0007446 [Colletotrichum scovillei]
MAHATDQAASFSPRTSANLSSNTAYSVSLAGSEDEEPPIPARTLSANNTERPENVAMLPAAEKDSSKPKRKSRQRSSGRVIWQMIAFYVLVSGLLALGFMATHMAFFTLLDGQPVATSGFSQNLQAALANFLAIAVEICLLSGIAVAYDQTLWRLLRRKALRAYIIDKLVTLVLSPWNLFRLELLTSAPELWLIAFLCFMIPVTVVFPPGALTVEFENAVLPVTLTNVPTLDISNWGNGTARDFMRLSLMEPDNDLIRPNLRQIASLVISLGEPVHLTSPCTGPCTYNLVFDGPKFDCNQPKPTKQRYPPLNPCTRDVFYTENGAYSNRSFVYNNTLVITWDTMKGGQCIPDGRRTMDCTMELATYNFTISDSQNGTREIQTKILKTSPIWTDEAPVQKEFATYFFDYRYETAYDSPIKQQELTRNFTRAQAFAIRKAAVDAMVGGVFLYRDERYGVELPWIKPGPGSLAAGSPYIGLEDKFNPTLDISPQSIERYLQDVVISTVSLNQMSAGPLWVNSQPVEALAGANIYSFSEPWQFYAPYVSCLVVTLIVYILGWRAIYRNGCSAGNSFLQFVVTTSTSSRLHELGKPCSIGGSESFSKGLKEVKLRFGIKRTTSDVEAGDGDERVVVLGTESEIESLRA